MIVVHAGNRPDQPGRETPRFPASQVAAVEHRVAALLDALRPEAVVSAPAAGADLIVLAAAQRRGIPVHIVLGIDLDAFIEQSVADAGETWVTRFRSVT